MELIKGKCFCGDIRYTISGKSLWLGHCHCSQCSILHGASFVSWVAFDKNKVSIKDFDKMKIFDSGIADRGFCRNCGTSLYFRYNSKNPDKRKNNYIFFTKSTIESHIEPEKEEHIYCQ